MKVFVAGATGVQGRALVPQLVARGHDVVGMTGAAAQQGDLQGLEALLAHDVVFRGDGGGKAPAAARAVRGRARVARLLTAGLRTLARAGGFTTRPADVNGQPGALFFDRDGRLLGVTILDVADGRIQGVNAIVNPDKLRHLGPVGDLRGLLRERG
jgi:hypothetical protein